MAVETGSTSTGGMVSSKFALNKLYNLILEKCKETNYFNPPIDSPSPDSYRAQSDFEGPNIMSNSRAFTFGAGREAYDKVYVPS